MPEQAPTTAIRATVATRLAEISIINGYRTNAGADVRTEPTAFEPGDGTRITIYPAGKTRPDDARSRGERGFVVVLEALVPTSLETAMAEIEAVEADIEQALETFLPQPAALPLEFRESLFLDRPDGIPAQAVQMMFGTRYRR